MEGLNQHPRMSSDPDIHACASPHRIKDNHRVTGEHEDNKARYRRREMWVGGMLPQKRWSMKGVTLSSKVP